MAMPGVIEAMKRYGATGMREESRREREEERRDKAAAWGEEKQVMEKRLFESTMALNKQKRADLEATTDLRQVLRGADIAKDAINLYDKNQNPKDIDNAVLKLTELGDETLIDVLKGVASGSEQARSEFDSMYGRLEQRAIDRKIRKVEHSAAWKKTKDEGLDPSSTEGKTRIKELNSASGQTINIGSENALMGYTKDVLGMMGKSATSAPSRLASSQMGLNILKNRIQSGNETGKWAPLATEAAAWLGVNEDEVAQAQLFDVKMGDMVMERIQQTKGAVSEKEMAYFGKISPGSDKEPFTNYVLLEIDRRSASREQDKMTYVREYLREHKDMLGFDQWYLENKDPFEEFDLKKLKVDFDAWSKVPDEPTPIETIEVDW